MSSAGQESSCWEGLNHPIRQALFAALRIREATAEDLQAVFEQPLKRLNYHLKVLVNQRCLEVRDESGRRTYRVLPEADGSPSPSQGDPE
jgi:hypothetical protein